MNTAIDASTRENRTVSAGRFEAILSLLFLAYLALACLVTAPLTDINEPKWFVIRSIAPLLFAAVLLRALARGERLQVGPIGLLGSALFAITGVSLIGAVNIGNGLTEISRLAGLLSTFFVAARLGADAISRDRAMWMLLLIGAASSVYGIAQHHGYDFMSWQQHEEVPVTRGVSFYGHATFAASVLIQIIPIALGVLIATANRLARITVAVMLALMLYHLSFTGARVATVSFVFTTLGAGIWLVIRRRREHGSGGLRAAGVPVLLAAASVVVAAVATGGWFVVRAWQTKQSDPFAIRQSSMALRLYNWETASRMIYAHPVTGVGAGNYEVVSPLYWNDVEQMRTARYGRWMQEAHNEYLQTAVELGLPGVGVLLAIIAYGLVCASDAAGRAPSRRERLVALGLATSVAAIALDANITFSLQAPASALVFWSVLGLIAGTHARLIHGAER